MNDVIDTISDALHGCEIFSVEQKGGRCDHVILRGRDLMGHEHSVCIRAISLGCSPCALTAENPDD